MLRRMQGPIQGLQDGFQGYGDLAGRARDFHDQYDQQHLSAAIENGPQAYANESFNQARGKWNYGSPMDQFMQASQEAGGGLPMKFGYEDNPPEDLSRSSDAIFEGLRRGMPVSYTKSTQLGTTLDRGRRIR